MDFLKRLFGGGGTSPANQGDGGTYAYVKLNRSGEVVRLRFMRGYDISQNDEGRHFSRKMIVGSKTFERVTGTFYFDKHYAIEEADLEGGILVDEAAYNTYQAERRAEEQA